MSKNFKFVFLASLALIVIMPLMAGAAAAKKSIPVKTPAKPVVTASTLIAGTVTKIAGLTLTVAAPTKKIYTVDAGKARLTPGPGGVKLTVTDIRVGDKVRVIGKLTGSKMAALTLLDETLIIRSRVK